MKIVIIGATGTIGKGIVQLLTPDMIKKNLLLIYTSLIILSV